jgi:prepilin signal peptidase PulO-like enzyme (type II secretory pathway)
MEDDKINPLYFIPLIGRFVAFFEEWNDPYKAQWKKVVILLENTIPYYLLGYFFGLFFSDAFILITILVFIITGYIEFHLILKYPKFFLAEEGIAFQDFKTFILLTFFHEWSFLMFGFLIGGM